jgi:hypothetical protein
MNTYRDLSATELLPFAVNFQSVVGTTPANWNLSTAQITALSTASDELQAANDDYTAKEAAFRSAVRAREAARQASIDAISSAANSIYAKSSLTPAQIASTGLSPRSTSRTKVVPSIPNELVALPNTEGAVQLKWKRNGNPGSVTFIVQSSADGETWANTAYTSKSRATLSGFTPGTPAWFRICATRNDLVSTPCQCVSIYAPEPPAQLSLKVA